MNMRKILLGLLVLGVGFIGTIVIMMNSTNFLKSPTPASRTWSIEEKNSTIEVWRKYTREGLESCFGLKEIEGLQSSLLAYYDAMDNLRKAERRCIEERYSWLQNLLHRYLPTVCGSPIYNWFYPYSERQEAIKNCTSSEYVVARSEFLRLEKEAIDAEKIMFESKKIENVGKPCMRATIE